MDCRTFIASINMKIPISKPHAYSSWNRIAVAIMALGASSMASAQTRDASATSEDTHLGLGLGGVVMQQPYRGVDNKAVALPLINFENSWLSVHGSAADLKLFSGDSASFRLRVSYALDGYKASDSAFLEGMDRRNSSVWVGAAGTWHSDIANVTADVLTDAMSNSKGSRARLQADHRIQAGRFGITPRVAAEWVDRKYVNYYYGVTATEARIGRDAYSGAATVNAETGVRLDYALSRHHIFFADAGYASLGSGIKNSSITGRPSLFSLGFGYIYNY